MADVNPPINFDCGIPDSFWSTIECDWVSRNRQITNYTRCLSSASTSATWIQVTYDNGSKRYINNDTTIVSPISSIVRSVSGSDWVYIDCPSSGGSGNCNCDPTPFNADLTVALDIANGSVQYGTQTGNIVLPVPTGTPVEKVSEILIYITGNGSTLDFDAAIIIPSDSAIVFPKTLANTLVYSVLIRYFKSQWNLVSLVGGY